MFKHEPVNTVFFILLVLLTYAVFQYQWPIYWFLILGGFWFLFTIIGSTNVQLNYFYPALHKNPGVIQQKIALTFDDGPHPNTIQILKLLKKYNAKATFFCIGHCIDEHPEIFKQIIAEGHTVGNHTYAHPKNYGFLKSKTIIREIETCNQAAKTHGNVDLKLFRSPFGVANPNIKKALKATEMQPIGWSLRSFDALFSSEDLLFKNITKRIKKGDVVLLHDNQAHTLVILERLLVFLQEHNFKSVTIDELFHIKAYA